MQLLSLNVGKPIVIEYMGKPLETGIYKKPVEGPVYLSSIQLQGDGQADLINHGGKDKAVCVYCSEHFDFWSQKLGRPLSFGAFGENFTVSGMVESEVHIGDIFEVGEALVQISQPRQPCFKLGKKYDEPELPLMFQNTGYTGYYFRVLKEGLVEKGQRIKLVDRHSSAVTIMEANRVKYHDKSDWARIRALLEIDALSESWRASFQKRLDSAEG
ncbi:MOSC domain-containing protein [Paenibacillus sp. 32352]|uniref:MOSC domain-containing protein n=1 Tax=Paenibacillus sp. 32352 TaxID=1969111 RepID=UPI0009ADCAC5|nr:MOSC domain-containing protein [Paenibacillus sp. 32352]